MKTLLKSIRIIILFTVACTGMHWVMSSFFNTLGDIQYGFVAGCFGIALFAALLLIFAENVNKKGA